MTNFLDRYNLRPQEKRIVIVAAFVVFILLNFWVVTPHFGDWSYFQEEIRKTRHKLKVAHDEIERVKGPDGYEAKLKHLENEGAQVLAEEQAIKFGVSVSAIGRESGIGVPDVVGNVTDSTDVTTSKFFTEKSLSITFQRAEESKLVGFLYSLGANSSMLRVKDLILKPTPNQVQLEARMTIVASYLKNPSKPAPAPAVKAPAPVQKPAVAGKPNIATNKSPAAVTGKSPLGDRRPGGPASRPGPPGGKAGMPTNSHPSRTVRPVNPASKQ